MEAKIEKISELSKLLSVKTRMSDDLFHLFGKFGIGHLLSRLSLEKQDGVSTSQATCSLVHSLTCPLTMLLCLLFTLSTSNLFTRPLVDLSTYHVTLSFYYPVYKQLVNSALIKSSTQHKKWRKNSNRLFFQYFFTTFVP